MRIDVYNTFELGDCPESTWKAIDAAQIEAAEDAAVVILNGPRYWLMNAFEDTKAVDPTPVMIGGLPTRLRAARSTSRSRRWRGA